MRTQPACLAMRMTSADGGTGAYQPTRAYLIHLSMRPMAALSVTLQTRILLLCLLLRLHVRSATWADLVPTVFVSIALELLIRTSPTTTQDCWPRSCPMPGGSTLRGPKSPSRGLIWTSLHALLV